MPNAEEQRRVEHQALRRRLIMGTYEDDLEEEMLRHFSADRYMALGPVDMSSYYTTPPRRSIIAKTFPP